MVATRSSTRAPRISAPRSPFATVIVGQDQERFVVHEHLLTTHSKFFRAALTGRFKESKDKVVMLAEEDSSFFEFFIHWLYYRRLPEKDSLDDEELVSHWRGKDSGISNAIKLYIFGGKYDIQQLRRALIDKLYGLVLLGGRVVIDGNHEAYIGKALPSSMDTDLAFDELDSGDPLCQFLVDVQCYLGKRMKDGFHSFSSKPFLNGVLGRYRQIIDGQIIKNRIKMKLCDYHEHGDQEDGDACKKCNYEAIIFLDSGTILQEVTT
ncbi:hypothetical protein GQ44DRAFT_823580 [Phaeosphaeriaceae sp. PMI808]|nr:hypothetical protein GQ44DRAFT_823580 [Phaeosphaeriaceae sp. PMI808]